MRSRLLFFSLLICSTAGNIAVAQDFNCGNVQSPLACSANPVVPIFSDVDIAVQYGIKYAVKNMLADISYKSTNPYLDDCGNVVPYNCKLDQEICLFMMFIILLIKPPITVIRISRYPQLCFSWRRLF